MSLPNNGRDATLVFVSVALLFFLLLFPLLGVTVDDAYISFRYAENLMQGNGLVYNVGEPPVEGYTNFLWIVLLAPFSRSPFDIEIASKTLSCLATFGSLFVLWKIPKLYAEHRTPADPIFDSISILVLCGCVPFLLYSVAGLETAVFTFLLLFSLYRVEWERRNHRYGISNLILLLLSLTRPEGVLFWVASLVVRSADGWRRERSKVFVDRGFQVWIAGYAIPALLYFAWRVWYFDQLLPNTFIAKTGNASQQFESGARYVSDMMRTTSPLPQLAAVGLIAIATTKQCGRPFLLYLASLLGVYTIYLVSIGGDWMKLFRFSHPALPLMALLIQEGARSLIRRHVSPIANRRVRAGLVIVLIGFIAIPAGLASTRNYHRDLQVALAEDAFWNRSAGITSRWLARHAKPGAWIAVGDIGEIGFRSHLRVIDTLGLVTPYVSHLAGGYTTKDPTAVARYVMEAEPEYIVMITTQPTQANTPNSHMAVTARIGADPVFLANYRTFVETRVTDSPHYWVIMRHDRKAPLAPVDPAVESTFEQASLVGWHHRGTAFGARPMRNATFEDLAGVTGFEGEQCLTSNSSGTGAITSAPFIVREPDLTFLVASGERSDALSVSLVILDEVVLRITASGNRRAEAIRWDVANWEGSEARIRIEDMSSTADGFIAVDFFRQSGH